MKRAEELSFNSNQSRIESIQVLRAIAAVIVAVYHSRDLIGEQDPLKAEIDFLFDSGPAGVPLFFVISGFIMVYISRDITFSPTGVYQFIVKRVLRIWPTYAVVTVVFYLVQHRFSIDPNRLSELLQSLFFIPISVKDPPFFGTAVLSVGWTLNYEIYFYGLVAISLFFSKYRWYAFFTIIAITLVIIPLADGNLTFKPDLATDFGITYINLATNPILWNFGYGVIIGLLYINPVTFNWCSRFFSKGIALIFVLAWVIWQYLSGFYGGFGPFQWGLSGAALFLAFTFYNAVRPLHFAAWLIWLGDISFSIYLVHMPVLVTLRLFFRKIGFPGFESGTAMFILTICMTIVVSGLSHKYLEIWLSTKLRNLFPKMKQPELREAEKVNL